MIIAVNGKISQSRSTQNNCSRLTAISKKTKTVAMSENERHLAASVKALFGRPYQRVEMHRNSIFTTSKMIED